MLQEQGFQVNLQDARSRGVGHPALRQAGRGEGNMIDCGWCTGSPEPDLVIRTHFHSSSKRITGIVDKEIDEVLDKERNAHRSRSARRSYRPRRCQTIARKAPALALFTSVFIHAYNKNLTGLYIYPNGMQDMTKATMT